MHILLRQQCFNLVRLIKMLIYRHEPLLDLLLHNVDTEGQTPELLAHLHQNIGREHQPHKRIRLAQNAATVGPESLIFGGFQNLNQLICMPEMETGLQALQKTEFDLVD